MRTDGLQKMLEYLELLRSRNIRFRIERQSPDDLMVTFSLMSTCVEVNFSPCIVLYSHFERDDSTNNSRADKEIRNLIATHWED